MCSCFTLSSLLCLLYDILSNFHRKQLVNYPKRGCLSDKHLLLVLISIQFVRLYCCRVAMLCHHNYSTMQVILSHAIWMSIFVTQLIGCIYISRRKKYKTNNANANIISGDWWQWLNIWLTACASIKSITFYIVMFVLSFMFFLFEIQFINFQSHLFLFYFWSIDVIHLNNGNSDFFCIEYRLQSVCFSLVAHKS